MKLPKYCLALILTATGSPALADMTANYVGPNNVMTMKIEIADNGDVRGETSNPNMYFITRADQGYVVQASFKGPVVMRVEDMATVMAEQLSRLDPKIKESFKEFAPTLDLFKGATVTIRGKQGTAYFMGAKSGRSPDAQPVVVISTDPALAPLGKAMLRQFDMSTAMMSQSFGDAGPFKSMLAVLATGAPLLFTGFELDSTTDDPIAASRFVLPVEPLSLEDVRKQMGVPKP